MSDWRAQAACLIEEPELFFPLGHKTRSDRHQAADAKAVCAGCLVVEACLTWAVEAGAEYGVWGGLSEDERRSLRRRKAKEPAPHGTPAGAKAHSRAGEPACRACLDGANLAKRLRREYAARGRIAAGLNMRRVS